MAAKAHKSKARRSKGRGAARAPSAAAIKAKADKAEALSKGEDPDKVEIEPSYDPLDPPTSEMGRPPKYKPEYARIARVMCERGATDQDLANAFDVSTVSIWRWQAEHEDFCNAMQLGKEQPDDRVKRSLYQRAIGYSYEAEELHAYQGSITRTKTIKHVPPDPGAAMHWLRNRAGWTGDGIVAGDGNVVVNIVKYAEAAKPEPPKKGGKK